MPACLFLLCLFDSKYVVKFMDCISTGLINASTVIFAMFYSIVNMLLNLCFSCQLMVLSSFVSSRG